MNGYLIDSKPKVTLILIVVLLISNILTTFIQPLQDYILLYPSNIKEPWNWYRLITYPLVVGGLVAWFLNSLVLLFTGYIIERRIAKSDLLGLIFISSIIGGLIFLFLNQNSQYNIPIASPTMISWGYWAASIVIGIKYWKGLNLFEKIILILCFLSILSIQNDNLGFLIGQIAVIVIIMTIALIKIKNKN